MNDGNKVEESLDGTYISAYALKFSDLVKNKNRHAVSKEVFDNVWEGMISSTKRYPHVSGTWIAISVCARTRANIQSIRSKFLEKVVGQGKPTHWENLWSPSNDHK